MDSQRSMNILWGCEGRAKNMVSGYLNLMNNEGFMLVVTRKDSMVATGWLLVVRESKEEKFGYTFLHNDESFDSPKLKALKISVFSQNFRQTSIFFN